MILLTKEELMELTGRERPRAQVRALVHMGIPFRVRPDGSPVVLRDHLETLGQALMGSNRAGARLAPLPEPQLQP